MVTQSSFYVVLQNLHMIWSYIPTGQENKKKISCFQKKIVELSNANFVIILLRNVPMKLNHKLYFDNYYTSIQLIAEVNKQGIFSLGTVRKNRVPNNKFPFPSEIFWKTEPRGTTLS